MADLAELLLVIPVVIILAVAKPTIVILLGAERQAEQHQDGDSDVEWAGTLGHGILEMGGVALDEDTILKVAASTVSLRSG
jgi:hypothetical protein